MSPLRGFGDVGGDVPWARAHGYIMPPRLGLNRREPHDSVPVGAESQLGISCRPGDMGNMVPSTCSSKAIPDGGRLVVFGVVCNPFRVG